MVGNTDDARIALTRFLAGDHTDILSMNGTTRMVWLINGIVYKCGDDGANFQEFDTIKNPIFNLPEHIMLPDVSLFEFPSGTVIAMEYIEGTAMAKCYCDMTGEACGIDCAPEDISEFMDGWGMDSGGHNIVYRDETYWIIDAG